MNCPVRQQYEIRLKEKGEKARKRSSEPSISEGNWKICVFKEKAFVRFKFTYKG